MIPRPPNHHDDDYDVTYWRYQPDCGCDLCEDYYNEMMDSIENDFWLDSSNEDWENG